jgi:hypothetical protein
MTTVMPATMTPEMHTIIRDSHLNEPKTHEARKKYVEATLTNIATKHSDVFLYHFSDTNNVTTFVEWLKKKETEDFTDAEMVGVKVLNTCEMKSLAMYIFKSASLGIFDKDEFYGFVDVPKGYKAKFDEDDNVPELEDINSDSDEE